MYPEHRPRKTLPLGVRHSSHAAAGFLKGNPRHEERDPLTNGRASSWNLSGHDLVGPPPPLQQFILGLIHLSVLGLQREWGCCLKVPWAGDRCILCLTEGPLCEEHLIPEALGGNLTSEFLCVSCNSRLGHASPRLGSGCEVGPFYLACGGEPRGRNPSIGKATNRGPRSCRL